MNRLALILALLFAVTATAQSSDEWNSPFPPPPPAGPVDEKPKDPPPPVPPPKQVEKPPAAKTGTPGDGVPKAVGEPLRTSPTPVQPQVTDGGMPDMPAADGGLPVGDDEEKYKLISQQERFVQERDEHSPSTIHFDVADKKNQRTTSTSVGTVGLLNVGAADLGPRYLLRLAITGEYFSSSNFPVRNALEVRTAGTFAVAMTPLQFLEVYLAYGASANTNSRSSPALIQALGDVTLGTKLSRKWATGFYGGVDLRAQSFSGVGSQDVGRWALGFTPRLVGTYDLREVTSNAPVRLHANAGIALDGTGRLVRDAALNSAEEYALGINRYNRVLFGVGAEVPLPIATPFIEYGLGVPLGTPASGLSSPDGTRIPVSAAMPQALSLGVKVTAVQDVTFLVGADIGLTRSVGAGIPATEPFNLYFGASYNIDPFARRTTRVVETLREKETKLAVAPPSPKTFKITGTVLDAKTKKPLSGVIVAMVGTGLPPVASDADAGRFLTHDFPPGAVKLQASKDGYKASEAEVTLTPDTQPDVQLVLEPDAKPSAMLVSAENAKDKKPLAAKVMVRGAKEMMVELTPGPSPTRVEVPPGKYTLEVSAEGFLSQTRDTQLPDAVEMAVAFQLQPQPKKKLVIVKENRIEILQQVHFATNKATILADSFQLLDSVVDAIIQSGVKKLRVEGHTDNRGGKAKNLRLSQERAAAVADYLIKAGVDPVRIESVGYGDARPIAPNMTARGRELNRRVEFVITDK